MIATPVQARHYRHHAHSNHHYYGRAAYRQSFRAAAHAMRRHHHLPVDAQHGIAAMVVDVNSGRTLYATNENELRHPASVTKVMTLYLLFEQMHRGRFTLSTPIEISAHAAAQPPTKIGLRPGSTISVENAIKAIVTESANDIAVAVAEAVGGSEPRFAEMMTRKAHALGMSQTLYVNASGLPDDRQITTARDLTILGQAIQERFPDEYAFFSTRNFVYGGRSHHNHNHLLGQIDGVDGIKTGYTRASGFNLLASVHRGGRHIVSVVIGGKSAVARDRIMTSLIEDHIADASSGARTAPMIAEAETAEPTLASAAPAEAAPPPQQQMAANERAPGPQPPPTPELSPIAETAPSEKLVTASLAPRPQPAYVSGSPRAFGDETASIDARERSIVLDGSTGVRPSTENLAYTSETREGAVRWDAGPARRSRAAERRAARQEKSEPQPSSPRREGSPKITARAESPRVAARAEAETETSERTQSAREVATANPRPRGGWIIQIGATEDLGKANDLLARARTQILVSARPFTEKIRKGDQTLYRARFAGLESGQAEAACKTLKRQGFPCIAVKN